MSNACFSGGWVGVGGNVVQIASDKDPDPR
jgi:hypothetical protein